MKKQKVTLLFTAALLIWLVQACNTAKPELTLEDAIKGNYEVGYSLSPQDDLVEIGTLSLADGNYVFTQQDGIDIPERIVDRLFFVEKDEGAYELIYDNAYQASQNMQDVAYGDFIARINFMKMNLMTDSDFDHTQGFFIGYSEENSSLYFHSLVSEIQFWYVAKNLE